MNIKHNRKSSVIPFTASMGGHYGAGADLTEAVVSLLIATLFGLQSI